MDYKNMLDSELAQVMVNYINRVDHLQSLISNYLEEKHYISEEAIRDIYKSLKEELREDSHYVSLQQNRQGSKLYMSAFVPSIREAASFGFAVAVNQRIDMRMFSSVEEARYKLTKYLSLEEWGALL